MTGNRKLAVIFHPEKWNNTRPFTLEEGREKFKDISNVYDSLIKSNILF